MKSNIEKKPGIIEPIYQLLLKWIKVLEDMNNRHTAEY